MPSSLYFDLDSPIHTSGQSAMPVDTAHGLAKIDIMIFMVFMILEYLQMKIVRVNVAEAKRHFSELLGRVAYGKEIITITRRGKPMAKLVPIGTDEDVLHMADIQGWLDEDDAFFTTLETIVAQRQTHPARVLAPKET
jgi:prevent-host-death family protein